jgi:hypothetical protein
VVLRGRGHAVTVLTSVKPACFFTAEGAKDAEFLEIYLFLGVLRGSPNSFFAE